MEKLKMHTPDLAEENYKKLAALFPDAVTETIDDEGKVVRAIDKDVLMQEINAQVVDDGQERYQFTWPDKRKSVVLANQPIAKTLRFEKEMSVGRDGTPGKADSENIYIEGDNLDALKLLQETYLGKVKMIYIDPPYNTGNDFIYEDDFSQNAADYAGNSGQTDDEGNRLVQNSESNGRFHTDWLNMIYPRLRLSKDLLSDDGVIFISIDDNEQENLRKCCDEIFGENNFIENYIWESTFRPDNSSPINRKNAEFILCYAKNKKCITRLIGGISSSDGLPSLTKNSMKESTLLITANSTETYLEDGVYLSGNKGNYVLLDDVIVKDGKIQNDFRLTGRMIWGQDYLDKQIKNGTKIVIKNDTFVPYTKKAEPTIQSPNKIIPKDRVSDILSANAERSQLFNTKVFDYPKPTSLLRYFLSFFETKNYTVLDYFSGSATTAHAVLQQNAEDDGQRKFIMVQLPEVCGEKSEAHKAGYKTICDIGEERIRRAGKKIKEETGADIDYGFRCFKVDSSNMKDVYYRPADIGQMEMDDLTDNIKEDRTPEDLLIQVMLDLGVLLSSKVEQTEIAGKKVFSVQDGYLIACFDKNVTEDVVTSIAKQHPFYAVFRDSSMADDSVAANFEQIFETYSPQTVRKVL